MKSEMTELLSSEKFRQLCVASAEFFIEIPIVRIVEKIVSSAKDNGIMLGFVQYKQAA